MCLVLVCLQRNLLFEYVDSKDVHHAYYHVAPLLFYKDYLGIDIDDYINCINVPTSDKKYYQTYSIEYLGNVVAGNKISMLNLPLDEFKDCALKQLKDGEPVWFGCECGKDGNREGGLWDDKQFDYQNTLDINLEMSKDEMLDGHVSYTNHAMMYWC